MSEVGFKKISFWNKSVAVLPSSKLLYKRCLIGYPISLLTQSLKATSKMLTKNCLAGIVQYNILKNKLGVYGIFYGMK